MRPAPSMYTPIELAALQLMGERVPDLSGIAEWPRESTIRALRALPDDFSDVIASIFLEWRADAELRPHSRDEPEHEKLLTSLLMQRVNSRMGLITLKRTSESCATELQWVTAKRVEANSLLLLEPALDLCFEEGGESAAPLVMAVASRALQSSASRRLLQCMTSSPEAAAFDEELPNLREGVCVRVREAWHEAGLTAEALRLERVIRRHRLILVRHVDGERVVMAQAFLPLCTMCNLAASDSNAYACFSGSHVSVRASRAIEAGEPITMSGRDIVTGSVTSHRSAAFGAKNVWEIDIPESVIERTREIFEQCELMHAYKQILRGEIQHQLPPSKDREERFFGVRAGDEKGNWST
jgi:hypothetical protein